MYTDRQLKIIAVLKSADGLDEWFPSAGKYRGEQQDTADGY